MDFNAGLAWQVGPTLGSMEGCCSAVAAAGTCPPLRHAAINAPAALRCMLCVTTLCPAPQEIVSYIKGTRQAVEGSGWCAGLRRAGGWA